MTAVEFAVVAPVLFLFIFGIVEFGRMVMVQQLLTNAAREGARRGILEQATASEVETITTDYLEGCSVSGATVSVSPENFDQVWFGHPIRVSVSAPYSDISWLPAPWFLDTVTLSVESMMLAERLE